LDFIMTFYICYKWMLLFISIFCFFVIIGTFRCDSHNDSSLSISYLDRLRFDRQSRLQLQVYNTSYLLAFRLSSTRSVRRQQSATQTSLMIHSVRSYSPSFRSRMICHLGTVVTPDPTMILPPASMLMNKSRMCQAKSTKAQNSLCPSQPSIPPRLLSRKTNEMRKTKNTKVMQRMKVMKNMKEVRKEHTRRWLTLARHLAIHPPSP
jgi:hypothetical protein